MSVQFAAFFSRLFYGPKARRYFTPLVKLKFAIILGGAVCVFGVAYALLPDRSVDYTFFQTRFSTAISSGGFKMVESASIRGDYVPLPLSIRWHPRRWHSSSAIRIASGFPDSAEHYKLFVDGSPSFDCFVRYLDGRAALIDIRANFAQEHFARTLRSTLAHEFPELRITLTTNDAS